MGIHGLWQLLEPAARLCTLNDISRMAGYSAAEKGRIVRIGVDISVVMNECIAADKAAHLYRYRHTGPLRIFFFKLCKFLREAPVIMIFVFDGPNRPSFKRGKKIDTQAVPEWSEVCKDIIEAFGFYCHQAPGEAEAELAMLSRSNFIDAVLTSDVDSVVFGAQCVIKSIPRAPEEYMLYSMDAIENGACLSYGSLLLIALLSKGDYSGGLVGCGPNIAVSLARCGFGDRILRAVNRWEDIKLWHKLENIAEDIRAELRNNSGGFLSCRHPGLASSFSVDIISQEKIFLYLYPVVSNFNSSTSPNWIEREPKIPRISQFCISTLRWAPNTLEKKVFNILWPGVFLRILTSPLLVYYISDDNEKRCLTPYTHTVILKIAIRSRRAINKSGMWARVEYSTASFRELLGVIVSQDDLPQKCWVPVEYLPVELAPPRSTEDSAIVTSTAPSSRQIIDLTDDAFEDSAITNSMTSSSMEVIDLTDLTDDDDDDVVSWPPSSTSSSPDPPSIQDLLGFVHGSKGLPPEDDIMEIVDSDDDWSLI